MSLKLAGKKICFITTVPMPMVWFMGAHIYASVKRYEVTLLTNASSNTLGNVNTLQPLIRLGAKFININIKREIAYIADAISLIKICTIFFTKKFDIVHSITPKAGLLSMVAALLVRVPVRIHLFTGQVWVDKKGVSRVILKNIDKITALCATHVLADSISQRQFLIDENIVNENKIRVLNYGSVSGVDMQKFSPDPDMRKNVRMQLNIPDDAIVALYLGRIAKDKGIVELIEAYNTVVQNCNNSYLIIVGPDECNYVQSISILQKKYINKLHYYNYTEHPEYFMQASDYFVLPSYREGFGTTIIEAAACGIPAIGTMIYGLSDAIVDGITGVLIPKKNVKRLSEAMLMFSKDHKLRNRLGEAAKRRVESEFKQEALTYEMQRYYEICLREVYGEA